MNAFVTKSATPIALAFLLVTTGLLLTPYPALAFGGSPPKQTHTCPKGQAWNGKKCVRTSRLNDDQLIEQGRQLAVTGHYKEAIGVLEGVSNKDNPLALTYLGYSHRKMGAVERGMALYHQALAIDPNSVVTREYLGEGYVEIGRIELARLELAKVERLCGNTACEEYHDLAEAIQQASAQ